MKKVVNGLEKLRVVSPRGVCVCAGMHMRIHEELGKNFQFPVARGWVAFPR